MKIEEIIMEKTSSDSKNPGKKRTIANNNTDNKDVDGSKNNKNKIKNKRPNQKMIKTTKQKAMLRPKNVKKKDNTKKNDVVVKGDMFIPENLDDIKIKEYVEPKEHIDEDDEEIKKVDEQEEPKKIDKVQKIIRDDIVNQLISRIDMNSIAYCIKEKGCIVGKSIVIEIIGISCWNKLTIAEQDILSKQVDKVRMDNRIMYSRK